jgi:hypothetical protein
MRAVTVISAVLLLMLPAAAQAKHVIAPPGNSGIDEYVPSLPSASGNHPVGGAGKGTSPLSAKTRRQLASLGAAGRAAERLAAATGTGRHRAKSKSGSNGEGGGAPVGTAADPRGKSRGKATVDAATKGFQVGGLGTGLPIILGITGLGAVLLGLRRRGTPPS